jgi:hypothetical protein
MKLRIREDTYESKVLTFNLKVYLSEYHLIGYAGEPYNSVDFTVTINPNLACTTEYLSAARLLTPTNSLLEDWSL